MQIVEVGEGVILVDIFVIDDWGVGVYVIVFFVCLMDVDNGLNLLCVFGLSYVKVDSGVKLLQVGLNVLDQMELNVFLIVGIDFDGIVDGEIVYVILVVVDVGIFNLMGFESLDFVGYYFG